MFLHLFDAVKSILSKTNLTVTISTSYLHNNPENEIKLGDIQAITVFYLVIMELIAAIIELGRGLLKRRIHLRCFLICHQLQLLGHISPLSYPPKGCSPGRILVVSDVQKG